jgi:ankyrin repeat protein
LHVAAELGFSEIVEFLLAQRPSDVGIGDRQLNTPLHLAMMQKHKEACRLLLEAGSDVMVRNVAGQSVLATGELRVMVQKFITKRPEGLRTRPIDRTTR